MSNTMENFEAPASQTYRHVFHGKECSFNDTHYWTNLYMADEYFQAKSWRRKEEKPQALNPDQQRQLLVELRKHAYQRKDPYAPVFCEMSEEQYDFMVHVLGIDIRALELWQFATIALKLSKHDWHKPYLETEKD